MTSMASTLLLAGSLLFSATFQAPEDKQPEQSGTQTEETTVPSSGNDDSILPEAASGNGTLPTKLDENSGNSTLNAGNDSPNESSTSLFSFGLQHKPAGDIANVLKDVLKKANASSSHQIVVDRKNNALLVRGSASDVKMVEAIIILLDRKEQPVASTQNTGSSRQSAGNTASAGAAATIPADVKIYPLQYQNASELSLMLGQLYGDLEPKVNLRIAAEPRTNSLLITAGSKSVLDHIESLIKVLDVPISSEQAKQIRQQGSADNPFQKTTPGIRQSGVTTSTGSRWQPLSRQETAAGRPVDLIQLSEAYANAHRDVQLAEVEYKNASELVKTNAVTPGVAEEARVKIDAARLKLDLLKQIAEAALQEAEEELAELKTELNEIVPSDDARQRQQRTIERRISQQQNRLTILKKILSR